MENIAQLRQEYQKGQLLESEAQANPLHQFHLWFEEALAGQVLEPNAFTLSTVDENGMPNARVLLLKGYHEEGFEFYTNLGSTKSLEIAGQSTVALTFLWLSLERQVRIRGNAELLTRSKVQQYFMTRPRESQIGAWVSAQSQPLDSYSSLEKKFESLLEKYNNESEIPLPEYWGGYLIRPFEIEFWQGRPSRLHDRLKYTLLETAEWHVQRLSP